MGIPASHFNQPSRSFAPLVESDTVAQDGLIREVVCLTAGNLVVTNWSDVETTFPMTPGQSLRINPKLVKAASTGTYAALR